MSQIISASAIEFVKDKSGKEEILGTGQFGVVKKAVWTRSRLGGRLTVAVKCLHQGNLESQSFVDIVNEISAMCNLNHPNLIKLYGIVFNGGSNSRSEAASSSSSSSSSSNDIVMMVTELAPHGSLYAHLRKLKLDNKNPPLSQIYSFIYQIGISYFN